MVPCPHQAQEWVELPFPHQLRLVGRGTPVGQDASGSVPWGWETSLWGQPPSGPVTVCQWSQVGMLNVICKFSLPFLVK